MLRVFVIAQLVPVALFLAYLVGSLVFVGARLGESQSPVWGEILPWPVFFVPAWLIVVPALIGAALVVPLCIRVPAALVGGLTGAMGPAMGAVLASAGFGLLFPASDGLLPLSDGEYLGSQAAAVPFGVFSVAVLAATAAAKGREYDRLLRSGELFGRGPVDPAVEPRRPPRASRSDLAWAVGLLVLGFVVGVPAAYGAVLAWSGVITAASVGTITPDWLDAVGLTCVALLASGGVVAGVVVLRRWRRQRSPSD